MPQLTPVANRNLQNTDHYRQESSDNVNLRQEVNYLKQEVKHLKQKVEKLEIRSVCWWCDRGPEITSVLVGIKMPNNTEKSSRSICYVDLSILFGIFYSFHSQCSASNNYNAKNVGPSLVC